MSGRRWCARDANAMSGEKTIRIGYGSARNSEDDERIYGYVDLK